MSTQLLFGRDASGLNAYAPGFAVDCYSATLPNGSAESITVPSNFQNWIAVFSFTPGATVWVSLNDTAAIPAGATFAATTSELNPGARAVLAGDTISLISNSTGDVDVGVILYAVP